MENKFNSVFQIGRSFGKQLAAAQALYFNLINTGKPAFISCNKKPIYFIEYLQGKGLDISCKANFLSRYKIRYRHSRPAGLVKKKVIAGWVISLKQ